MGALHEFLQNLVDDGLITGGIAAIDRDGEREIEVMGDGVCRTSIARIQSMTKPIVAAAVMRSVESGALGLDDQVDHWLPELSSLRVLASPTSHVSDTVALQRPITVRHLLTCTSGYGMETSETPVAAAKASIDPGSRRSTIDADEWIARLSEIPLTFQPGTGWRYHTSFSILGIMLERFAGVPLQSHLAETVLAPLGMTDTGYWVPEEDSDRLMPVSHVVDGSLEPFDAGTFVAPATHNVCHGELTSTLDDYLTFARMLRAGGGDFLSTDSVAAMTSDQVDDSIKTPGDFFGDFWVNVGWGFGMAIEKSRRNYGWTGGLGTDFWVNDDDQSIGILLTQTELSGEAFDIVGRFAKLSR